MSARPKADWADCQWVSYPKGTAIPTDLKRDVVREVVENAGLKAVAQVAIDGVWSALRFKTG